MRVQILKDAERGAEEAIAERRNIAKAAVLEWTAPTVKLMQMNVHSA